MFLLTLILIVFGFIFIMEISFFSKAIVNNEQKMTEPEATIEPSQQPIDDVAEYETGNNVKKIYLTFDDGPYIYTSKLLDYLDAYNAKATFFVTNQNSDYTYLIKDEYDRGHAIGIHTASHKYWQIYKSDQALADDINEMSDIIYNLTGYRTNLYRFPGGSSNTISSRYCDGIISRMSKILDELNYIYFDWDVASGDSDGLKQSQAIFENCISEITTLQSDEIVILQHDIYDYSVEAVPLIIQWGIENGYEFVSLDENSRTAHLIIVN